METAELKEILYQRIEVAEPELLQRMFEVSEGFLRGQSYSHNEMVMEAPGDRTATEPALPRMTREEMNADIAQGLLDYKEGRYVDLETFIKEGESW